jgi:pyruvate/2-oxoglutarate/acetoin dehydrogenase E1 component
VLRVTGWDTPVPHAQESRYIPGRDRIARAMRAALAA